MPLEVALQELSLQFEVPLDLTQSDLENPGPGALLTLPPGRYTLAAALQAAEPMPLGWYLGSEHVAIDEFAVAGVEFENYFPTRFYDLRDLARLPGRSRVTSARARRMLMEVIAPESWSEVGGPGEVRTYRGLLVISQSWAVHRRIERLFDQLRARHGG
jgi:hypothetical protein